MVVRLAGGLEVVGVAAVAAFLAVASGCRFQSQAPQDQKRAWQRNQAKGLAPAELGKPGGAGAPGQQGEQTWGRVTRVLVRAHADPEYLRRNPDWKSAIEDQLTRAGQVLGPALSLRLVLQRAQPWQRTADLGNTDAMLAELAEHDAGEDVHFVIGFVGAASKTIPSFHEMGAARRFGKHLIVRAMDDVQERRVLTEGLDALDREERERLYQARKRHKQTVVLLHELGHALGAMHTRKAYWIMHPAYHHDMQAFAPANRKLMQLVAKARLDEQKTGEPIDLAALVAEIIEAIDRENANTWQTQEREQVRAALVRARVMAEGAEGAGQGDAGQHTAGAAAESSAPAVRGAAAAAAKAPSEAALAALSEPDRAAYSELAGHVAAGRARAHFDAIQALAARYPDVYGPQELLCQAAMSVAMPADQVQAHCQRMGELAAQGMR